MDSIKIEKVCAIPGKKLGLFSTIKRQKCIDSQVNIKSINIGGPITKRCLVFCNDDRYVAGSGGRRLRIFNPITGLVLREIKISQYINSEETVELIGKDPRKDDDVFYTLSNKKCVDLWSLKEDTVLDSIKLRGAISDIAVDSRQELVLYVLLVKKKNDKDGKLLNYTHKCYKINLKDRSWTCMFTLNKIHTRSAIMKVARTTSNCFFCAFANEIYVIINDSGQNSFVKYKFDANVSCMTINNEDNLLGVGDTNGTITLFRTNFSVKNSLSIKNNTIKRVLHWHSQSVSCLEFSQDSSIIYSGGYEMVLVIWFIEENFKKFIPRVKSPIKLLISSPKLDSSSVIALLNDNSAALFDIGSMSRIGTISGPNEISVDDYVHSFDHVIDNSYYVILQKRNGVAQIFNYSLDIPSFEIDVTCENLVSNPNSVKIPGSKIKCLLISKDGKWMITTDSYDADVIDENEVGTTLKIWDRTSLENNFSLSTRICFAHSKKITSADISPATDKMFATASYDHSFKVWTFNNNKWSFKVAKDFRDSTPLSIVFNSDGAILAVTYPKSITLWCPHSLSLMTSLSFHENPSSWRNIKFAYESHLISYTNNKLCVWDLHSLTVAWCIRLPIKNVSTHPNSNLFLVTVFNNSKDNSCNILLFNVSSPVPSYSIKSRSNHLYSKLICISQSISVFTIYSDSSISISYFVNDPNPLTTLPNNTIPSLQSINLNHSHPNQPQLVSSKKHIVPPTVNLTTSSRPDTLFKELQYSATPSHLLFPVRDICSDYLKSFLSVKPKN